MNARDKWIKDVDWRRKGKRREKTPTKSMKRKFIDWTREKKRTNSSHSLAIETIRNLCRRLFEFYFCLFLFRLITCYSPDFGWHFFWLFVCSTEFQTRVSLSSICQRSAVFYWRRFVMQMHVTKQGREKNLPPTIQMFVFISSIGKSMTFVFCFESNFRLISI